MRKGASFLQAHREALISAAAKGAGAAQDFWRRLRVHLRPDGEALEIPEPRRRTLIERDLRRGVERAIREGPIPCGEASIKLYSLGP